MKLVHKSVYIEASVWQQLRINANISGCSLRDYLTYLIKQSHPIEIDDATAQAALAKISATYAAPAKADPILNRRGGTTATDAKTSKTATELLSRHIEEMASCRLGHPNVGVENSCPEAEQILPFPT